MAADVRSLACSYVRDGGVLVCRASGGGNDSPPTVVRARVQGRRARYFVRLNDGVWVCSCDEPDLCAHVAAVQLVTGHEGLASPAGRPALAGSGER
jgi:uncharacterized Zn finger protein